jgi:hypothetical protein
LGELGNIEPVKPDADEEQNYDPVAISGNGEDGNADH